jgi:DNA-binding response OmpR family regulator
VNERAEPARQHILVVEDDATLRDGLARALTGEGFAVDCAADGYAARKALAGGHFDLVILDLMLPGPGGLELLRAFRAVDTETPVLILTARGDESDKVAGLGFGADDYVTKPFGLRELIARVRAHLRRQSGQRQEEPPPPPFRIGTALVDLGAFVVERDGVQQALSPKEAAILTLLLREQGRALHRNAILDAVWGRGRFVTHRTIDTHVLNLRQKVESDPRQPRHLLTVHGVGYRLVLDAEGEPAEPAGPTEERNPTET